MKTVNNLKDVFSGVSSLFFSKANTDLDSESAINIAWDYELPVTVDTLQLSQDDPTINHYKVIGLQGDWASTAQAGDFTVQFTVPTKHADVLKLAFGDDAVGDASVTIDSATWSGKKSEIDLHKVTGTIGLLNEAKDQLMVVTNIALYAKPMYENPGTEPFAIQFTGTVETNGGSNFAWLKKTA